MKCEEMIKEVYFVAGVLEGMTYAKGSLMTEAMESKLADCVDRLELVGAHLLKVCDPQIEVMMPTNEQLLDLLNEEKVNVHAGRPTEAFGRVYPAPEEASDQ